MKARTWFGVGFGITLVVVVGLLLVAMLLWNHQIWNLWPTAHAAMMGDTVDYSEANLGAPDGAPLSDKELADRFLRAAEIYGSGELRVAEILEFEHNYYAILTDRETGAAVGEVVLDKASGVVVPEMGPNLLWNRTDGMDRHMGLPAGDTLQRADLTNPLSVQQAVRIAQDWLAEHAPELEAGNHAVSFPGYYTLHTLQGGQIEGMLSVNGESGQVWYHTWHGEFRQMLNP